MSDFKILYITCPNKEEAQKLSRYFLEKKLIACANIFPEIESIYNWKGGIESQMESVLIFKTTSDKVDLLKQAINDIHSYDCPCILVFDIESLNESFASFLTSSVG